MFCHHTWLSPRWEALAAFTTNPSDRAAYLLVVEPRLGLETTHICGKRVCARYTVRMVPSTKLCRGLPHVWGAFPCRLLRWEEEQETLERLHKSLLPCTCWHGKPFFFFFSFTLPHELALTSETQGSRRMLGCQFRQPRVAAQWMLYSKGAEPGWVVAHGQPRADLPEEYQKGLCPRVFPARQRWPQDIH